MKEFKYKSVFDNISFINASCGDEDVDKFVSQASLENLERLGVPEGVDLKLNVDLVLSTFNAAVINRINRNGDGIDHTVAQKIKNSFIHKPSNLAHKKSRIVGHIVDAGWSSFGTSEVLSDEEISEKTEPFNLVLSSVIYRLVDKKFADLVIDSTDESNSNFRTVSASWELAYDDYVIVRAPADNPKTRNIAEMERIEDAESIAKLEPFLLSEDGSGYDNDGRVVGRLIVSNSDGDVIPLGHAFTNQPAAEVEGVILQDASSFTSEEEKAEKISKSEKKISENEKITVNDTNKKPIMEIKSTKDILALIPDQESHANITKFIADKIEEKSSEIKAEVANEKTAKENAENKVAQLESDLDEAKSSLANVKQELSDMKSQAEAKANQDLFQERMEALNTEFELSEADCQVIVNQIKDLDVEAYANWHANFTVLASEKKKEVIAARKEEIENLKNESKAAEKQVDEDKKVSEAEDKSKEQDEVLNEAVSEAEEKGGQSISNATDVTQEEKSMVERWGEAFGDSIKVNF